MLGDVPWTHGSHGREVARIGQVAFLPFLGVFLGHSEWSFIDRCNGHDGHELRHKSINHESNTHDDKQRKNHEE